MQNYSCYLIKLIYGEKYYVSKNALNMRNNFILVLRELTFSGNENIGLNREKLMKQEEES